MTKPLANQRTTTRRAAVTMKDIAEQVGVSKMAVSAVLSGTSTRVGVSVDTRARILSVARQLEYRPNAIARALSSKRTNIIGLYSGYRYLDPRNPFLAEIVGGLQEGCATHRKDLLLHSVFRGDSVEDIYSELVDGRIDGLVITAPPDDPLVERLAASPVPVVAVADAIDSLPSLVVDDTEGAQLTVDHLLKRGHHRFTYRCSDRRVTSAERRRIAYKRVAQEKNLTMTDWRACDAPAASEAFLDAWLESPGEERPTAVACWNDVVAYEFVETCVRRGIRVPKDLAVTGFDGAANPAAFQWRLTTVHAPWAEVAKTAVDLLVSQLDGKEVPQETVFPVSFIAGDSA